jgi:membrane associated rhomboid family serine protease
MFRRLSIKDLYIQIIVLNLAIFLIANIANSFGSTFFVEYFALPLQNPLPRFWTIITAHFLHLGFGHVFNNMIIILLFGYLAQYLFRKQSILSIYVVSAIFSSMIILLVSRGFGAQGVAYGASCAAFAIMMAVVVYKPNFVVNLFILGPVRVKWIALVLIVLGVVIDFSMNLMGNIGHLAGIIFGSYYGWKAKQGVNSLKWFDDLFKKWKLGETNTVRPSPQTVHHNKKRTYHYKSNLNMDAILDKISKKGMSSLTKEEKEFLEKS